MKGIVHFELLAYCMVKDIEEVEKNGWTQKMG